MNRKILLTSAGACALFSANVFGTLVAGWDFSQFAFSGANSINGSDFVGAGVATANFSDLQDPSPGIGADQFGAIYYEGSNGSTDITPDAFTATTAPASRNLLSAVIQTADGNPFNDAGSYLFLAHSGQAFISNLSLGVQADSSIVFSADISSENEVGSNWEIRFAAKDLLADESSSISWEVSTDGSSYVAVAGDPIITTSLDTEFVVAGGAALNGADTVFFRANISGIDTQLLFDNVGIHTTFGELSTTWGGYDIVTNEGGDWADASGEWMGFINVDTAPFLYSYEMDCWFYMPEPAAEVSGAWAFFYKSGANSIVSGWGGYPIVVNADTTEWVDASSNWLGTLSLADAPYMFNWESQCWMYFPEPAGAAVGAWIYVFKN